MHPAGRTFHLYRFACGGGPFDEKSQLYLCLFDVEVNAEEGVPTDRVRLTRYCATSATDRVCLRLRDGWELTLRPSRSASIPTAHRQVTMAGSCAAGGQCRITRGEDLVRVPRDPRLTFDVDEANHWLIDPFLVLSKAEVNPALDGSARLAAGLAGRRHRHQPRAAFGGPLAVVATRRDARSIVPDPVVPRPGVWRRIPLTSAGYLTTEEVQAASVVFPVYSGEG